MNKETMEKIKKYLYRELEADNTNVEINELLDELENNKKEVYVLATNYSGWEDPEANGYDVELYDNYETAKEKLEKRVKHEIEYEKEFMRDFYEAERYKDYVRLADQYGENIEIEINAKEIL